MAWTHVAANEKVSLMFIDDIIAVKSRKMNYRVYRVILCSYSSKNALKLKDNDPKHTAKSTQVE